METNPPDEGLGVVAVNKKQLEGMDHHEYKLNLTAYHNFTVTDSLTAHIYIYIYNVS
jgi:hypothetical protein